MNLVNLEDKKDKKHYGVNSLLSDIKQIHDVKGIEMMAFVYKKKDGKVGIGTTYGNNAEFVGLFEIGKVQIIDEMRGDE